MEKPTTEQLAWWNFEEVWPGAHAKKVTLPVKLATLRQKLYQKAKQEPKFRFYALYDRVYRWDVLESAYRIARANKGKAGVDGIRFEDIEGRSGGVQEFLEDIQGSLRTKTYRPSAVRRTWIPKPDGRKRPLGIPTIRDRVIQTALLLIIEPIFEADFMDCSYGFRPQRSAHDALEDVRQNLQAGRRSVYDADLRGYFDSIPHDKLLKCLRMRIVDSSVLKLIRGWLEAPVVEEDQSQGPKITRNRKGTPQGGVISPLLANVYLHWFEKVFYSAAGPGNWAKARIVRYADDFAVFARYQGSRIRGFIEDQIESWLGLEINRDKTKVVDLCQPRASFDFLGFTFRYDRSLRDRDRKYLNVTPSNKATKAEREKLRNLVNRSQGHIPIPDLIKIVNRQLTGWSGYFSFGYPRKEMRRMNSFVRCCLIRHLKRRSQRPFRPPEGWTFHRQLKYLGLIYL